MVSRNEFMSCLVVENYSLEKKNIVIRLNFSSDISPDRVYSIAVGWHLSSSVQVLAGVVFPQLQIFVPFLSSSIFSWSFDQNLFLTQIIFCRWVSFHSKRLEMRWILDGRWEQISSSPFFSTYLCSLLDLSCLKPQLISTYTQCSLPWEDEHVLKNFVCVFVFVFCKFFFNSSILGLFNILETLEYALPSWQQDFSEQKFHIFKLF